MSLSMLRRISRQTSSRNFLGLAPRRAWGSVWRRARRKARQRPLCGAPSRSPSRVRRQLGSRASWGLGCGAGSEVDIVAAARTASTFAATETPRFRREPPTDRAASLGFAHRLWRAWRSPDSRSSPLSRLHSSMNPQPADLCPPPFVPEARVRVFNRGAARPEERVR